jgi:hypothetical protein
VTPADPAAQAEARIVAQVRAAPPPAPAHRRGRLGQRADRHRRQELVRRHAVAVATDIAAGDYTWAETARLLRITSRTLRQWRRRAARDWEIMRWTGRPAARSSPERRNAVIGYLDEFGPGIGLRLLRDAFPMMARAELDDLMTRYRRAWRVRHRRPLRVLEWTRPGAVWAVDFAEPPTAVDGVFPDLLAVRDLASGRQLLWHPAPAATAIAAAEPLAGLFVRHGPPLVVKSDNGSAFGAPAVATLLENFAVLPLFSPPHTPSYNGAVEAGIGGLKMRTEAHAARHGRPGFWTFDDVAAARREANATARPRGPNGPTPDEAWAARTRLCPTDRASFRASVAEQRRIARHELDVSPAGPWPVMTERRVDRVAIRRALVEHGVLVFSRRSIPPPIRRKKAEGIS